MSPRPARTTANARLQAPDWCHFTQRLPRSRAHKQVKGAELPFEDEKFAYVALTRTAVAAAPLPRAGAAGRHQGRGDGKTLHAGRSRRRKGARAAPRRTMPVPGAGAGATRWIDLSFRDGPMPDRDLRSLRSMLASPE